MMRGAIILALAVATPAAAQQTEPAPPVRTVPMLPPRHPEPVRFERVKTVDIPQAAKDAGHNGTATYVASVDADSKLTGLTLKESSGSPAIDDAVRARAERLWYLAPTDKAGTKITGTTEVRMSYARHDKDSPGGGIETYTCGDLTREWDWFTAANAQRRKLFWPHNAYTSLTSIEAMRAGVTPDREARLAARAQREAMWADLIKRCRKAPERLMLSEVDQPEAYARLVNSF
jgi:TonB family protein